MRARKPLPRVEETLPEREEQFTTRLFYGKLILTHFDDDAMRRIGKRVTELLKELNEGGTVKTLWIYHEDGREFVDAVMDKATGKWRKPESAEDHG